MISKLDLKRLLSSQEGFKLKPYKDTAGKITIGVGRCLDDIGISPDEAMMMLDNDIERAINSARVFKWFDGLSDTRQNAIICMIFNLGLGGFSEFKNMIKAFEDKDYALASKEMLDSKWSAQVGNRATILARMVSDG